MPLEDDVALKERIVTKIMSVQYGTSSFFNQMLDGYMPFWFKDDERADRFVKLLTNLGEQQPDARKPNFKWIIEEAEKSGCSAAVVSQLTAMKEKAEKKGK